MSAENVINVEKDLSLAKMKSLYDTCKDAGEAFIVFGDAGELCIDVKDLDDIAFDKLVRAAKAFQEVIDGIYTSKVGTI